MRCDPKEPAPNLHEKRLALAAELGRIAQELAALSKLDVPHGLHAVSAIPSGEPGRLAADLYADRRLRERTFLSSLFGEPAWDMLLDLFVQAERERPVCVSSLCIASASPSTTALRHIQILRNAGLVQISADQSDARRRLATLTPAGMGAMRSYLVEVQGRGRQVSVEAPTRD